MINSMTGFGGRETKLKPFGKISVELRSTNHKFLEIILHVPEGFLSFEDRLKKVIEPKFKRGRIVCVVNISGSRASNVFINKLLLSKYFKALKETQKEFKLENSLSLDTLVRLPGVLSLEEEVVDKQAIWPQLNDVLDKAVADLRKMRQKEGAAMQVFLKDYARELWDELSDVRARFKKVVKEKQALAKTDEEKASFLKNSDITEEAERLGYHIKNLNHKLILGGVIGKELDFIAQEMQRETNTIGAKSCDTLISARVVQMKSLIEKIREQVQNIE